ncbi:MAG: hypothetical protein HY567_00395 [Candidatus Kerfeldbacteria bacterium]|nr:hypothetical protein [Candidatus Kerfeldbacteria bacterium]
MKFMAGYQSDAQRIITDGSISRMLGFFQQGVWTALPPQAQGRLVKRLEKLSASRVRTVGEARDLSAILDTVDHPRLQDLHGSLIERFPELVPSSLPTPDTEEELEQTEAKAQTEDPEASWDGFWTTVKFPERLDQERVVEILDRLMSLSIGDLKPSHRALFTYAHWLNRWAHALQYKRSYGEAVDALYTRKSQTLNRLIELYPGRVFVEVETRTMIRVRLIDKKPLADSIHTWMHVPISQLTKRLSTKYRARYERRLRQALEGVQEATRLPDNTS